MSTAVSLPPPRVPAGYQRSELAAMFDVHEVTLEAWVRRGAFPPPIRLGRKIFWPVSVVARLLNPEGDSPEPAGAGRLDAETTNARVVTPGIREDQYVSSSSRL